MLILSRRIGETVTIGHDVRVTILEVKGHQVRVGIKAPKSVVVHREEIYQRINEHNNSEKAGKQAENWAGSGKAKIADLVE